MPGSAGLFEIPKEGCWTKGPCWDGRQGMVPEEALIVLSVTFLYSWNFTGDSDKFLASVVVVSRNIHLRRKRE